MSSKAPGLPTLCMTIGKSLHLSESVSLSGKWARWYLACLPHRVPGRSVLVMWMGEPDLNQELVDQ